MTLYSTKVRGFSLMELLAVVTILGIIAAVVVPRISSSSDRAKQATNAHNISTLNSAVERYYLEHGAWPSWDLSEIDTVDYFPDGLPINPLDGQPYVLDQIIYRVTPYPTISTRPLIIE